MGTSILLVQEHTRDASVSQEGWCRSTHLAYPSCRRAVSGAGMHIRYVHHAGGLVRVVEVKHTGHFNHTVHEGWCWLSRCGSTHWDHPSYRSTSAGAHTWQDHPAGEMVHECTLATSILRESWCTHWANPSCRRAGAGAGAHTGHVHPAGGLVLIVEVQEDALGTSFLQEVWFLST